jgi:hypothetical protein
MMSIQAIVTEPPAGGTSFKGQSLSLMRWTWGILVGFNSIRIQASTNWPWREAAEMIVTRNVRDFRRAQLHFSGLRAVTPQESLKELA